MAPITTVKQHPDWKWKVLKLASLALCLVLFFWQFSYIFRDYLDSKTTITTEQGHLPNRSMSTFGVATKDFTQTRFGSNRVADDMEGNGEFDFCVIYESWIYS